MYKKIWFKIHLILGITAGVILLVIAVTGAMLSFEKEILKLLNKDSYVVSVPNHNRLSTKELLQKFQEQISNAKINRLTFSSNASSSIIINIKGEGKNARKGINYFVNPYTGKILPKLKGKKFFIVVEDIHRRVMMKDIGKQIVAASVISLIFLLITGIYLYWSRIKKSFIKSFTFKFKNRGRAFISNMHSAMGMWVLPFYLLASLTGLYWSYDWYNSMLYKIAGVDKPQRKEFKQTNEVIKDYSLNFNDVEKATELFDVFTAKQYLEATLIIPKKGYVYSFSYLQNNPKHYRARDIMQLDIKSNQIIKNEKYEDKPLNEQLMKSILLLHTGEYFGIIGQIGMFLSSLLMPLFTITGFMLYLKRKRA